MTRYEFYRKNGIEVPEPKIVVRNDASADFRLYLLLLMLRYAGLKKVRTCVCFVTKETEDRNNWAENDFMKSEVQSILENSPWYRIYDIIESFYQQINDKIGFLVSIHPCGFIPAKTTLSRALMPRQPYSEAVKSDVSFPYKGNRKGRKDY